jgi:hypothetical protein
MDIGILYYKFDKSGRARLFTARIRRSVGRSDDELSMLSSWMRDGYNVCGSYLSRQLGYHKSQPKSHNMKVTEPLTSLIATSSLVCTLVPARIQFM